MSDQIFEDDVILLRDALPEHGLNAGRIGRIVQSVRLHEYEVEFGDCRAITAKVTLRRDQIQVLRHETALNDRVFWQMIEAAQAQSDGDPERGASILVDMLAERSIADIYSFGLLYRKS